MSYVYYYETKRKDKLPVSRGYLMTVLLTGCFIISVCSAVYRLWPEGAAVLDRLFSVERWQTTLTAMENLTEDLRSGLPVKDAVTAFCTQIVNYGLQFAS